MKTVYVHIGRGKTGTTAIQRTMSQHRDYLLARGIYYVSADDGSYGTGHQNFAKSFIRTYPDYMIQPPAPEETKLDVKADIAESPCPKIVLSSENFPLCDISDLQRFLFSIDSVQSVKIIFFVRSQDELAESQYNQFVKMTGMTTTFGEYIETGLDEVDYFATASEWATVFGEENVICRVYDAGSKQVIRNFLNCIEPGVELPNRTNPSGDAINESVGYFQLQMLLVLNQLKLDVHPWTAAQRLADLSSQGLPALLFDVEDARRYRERFARSNERFSARFLTTTVSDLGGRKYSDDERRAIRALIRNTTADESFDLLRGHRPKLVRSKPIYEQPNLLRRFFALP